MKTTTMMMMMMMMGIVDLLRHYRQSYFTTDSQSVSQSILALGPSGTHDQILNVFKTVAVFIVMGRPPCSEDGSVL
jgi:hypothetical protein